MLSLQQAQTGNRVYGGVSQAPNRGQVSAAGAKGYIQRELRNKNRAGVLRRVGSDGKSDNRSTVAAQALRRQGQGKQPFQNEGRPVVGSKNGKGQGNGPRTHDPNMAGPLGSGGAQQVPQIQIGADGILQLPYNQDFAVEQLAAINDANSQLLGMKAEGDQQALEYGQNKRQQQLAYDNLQRQTLNTNAAQGTAFSSGYGTAVANNATGFANQMGDLEAQNTGFLQNQALQRAAIQAALNQQLAALAQQYAHDLNDQAGGLGYGQAQQKTPKSNKKPRRKRGKK